MADITPDKISRSRDGLLKKGFQKSSTNRYVAALSSAYSMAVKEFGWIDTNPCSKVKKLLPKLETSRSSGQPRVFKFPSLKVCQISFT